MGTNGHGVLNPAGVIACSQLDAVVIGGAEDLLERFQHLGVLEMKQLLGIAATESSRPCGSPGPKS